MHVLVVDDQEDVRVLLGRFVERLGHTVTLAESTAAATTKFLQRRPDAITLDAVMPDGGGVAMLPWLKAEGFEGRVVLASGSDTHEMTAMLGAAQALGLDAAMLLKPFKLKEIQSALGAG